MSLSRSARSRFGALALPGLTLLGCVYLWGVTGDFRAVSGRYEAIGPEFFPRLLIGALAIMCLVQIARSLLRPAETTAEEADAAAASGSVDWRNLVTALAITGLYAASLHTVGFLIATPLFQAALLGIVFKTRRLVTLVLVPLLFTAAIAALFIGAMNAPLPRGRWLFGTFSRLFY
ncbi:tripartite tricarboxylate transporter TctB family protein [Acuticoccus sp. M5D2P5]|uniref:tripartite tricarboxylate transporter TctB family protein n=1 Tax=Acuticoccus kalidii TaxID=2910977 RepID=UPI001F192E43|nr:tripartite tricarboxylate transporter TctB family protein [Acuticoccus kalidii]MCF3936157.1 tripartite tricarboxylate transporter TctB family protein [Acuticoccus kalidii]